MLTNKIFVYVVIGTIVLQVLMVQVFAMSEKFGEALKVPPEMALCEGRLLCAMCATRRAQGPAKQMMCSQVRPISGQFWAISIGCAFFEFPFQLVCMPLDRHSCVCCELSTAANLVVFTHSGDGSASACASVITARVMVSMRQLLHYCYPKFLLVEPIMASEVSYPAPPPQPLCRSKHSDNNRDGRF
jgi:hypothetical protein